MNNNNESLINVNLLSPVPERKIKEILDQVNTITNEKLDRVEVVDNNLKFYSNNILKFTIEIPLTLVNQKLKELEDRIAKLEEGGVIPPPVEKKAICGEFSCGELLCGENLTKFVKENLKEVKVESYLSNDFIKQFKGRN